MPHKQQPSFLPLHKLPLYASTITGILQDTQKSYTLFLKAKEKPWVLDDATVERAIRLYTERLELLKIDEEQITRWKKEKLTRQQEQTLTELSEQVAKTRNLVTELLKIVHEIKQNTMNQLLERDPAELAIDVLMGKLNLPK